MVGVGGWGDGEGEDDGEGEGEGEGDVYAMVELRLLPLLFVFEQGQPSWGRREGVGGLSLVWGVPRVWGRNLMLWVSWSVGGLPRGWGLPEDWGSLCGGLPGVFRGLGWMLGMTAWRWFLGLRGQSRPRQSPPPPPPPPPASPCRRSPRTHGHR